MTINPARYERDLLAKPDVLGALADHLDGATGSPASRTPARPGEVGTASQVME